MRDMEGPQSTNESKPTESIPMEVSSNTNYIYVYFINSFHLKFRPISKISMRMKNYKEP